MLMYDYVMSEILKETSIWNCDSKQPNHTYLISDSGNIIAYAPWHGDKVIILKSKMKLDKRYRKFVKSGHLELSKIQSNEKPETGVRKFIVKSNDKEYTVILKNNSYSCSCIGFSFRGKCKHSTAVAEKLKA